MSTQNSRAAQRSNERPRIAKSLLKWGAPTLVLAAGLGTALATSSHNSLQTASTDAVAADKTVVSVPSSPLPSGEFNSTGVAGVSSRHVPVQSQSAKSQPVKPLTSSMRVRLPGGTAPSTATGTGNGYNGNPPSTPAATIIAVPGGGSRLILPKSLQPYSAIRKGVDGKTSIVCIGETVEQHRAHLQAGEKTPKSASSHTHH